MRKKTYFTPVIPLFVFIIAGHCSADIVADMEKAEKLYKAGKYSQAEQNYQNVIDNTDPNNPEDFELVLKAYRKLPVTYLYMGQQTQAQAVVQRLLAEHHDYEELPHAIHGIVEQAKEINLTLQTAQVYQNILQIQPKHPQTIWLKMGIAIANVYLNNEPAVESALQNIISQHNADKWAAEAFAQIGWAYYKLKKYDKARPIYQYVVDNWPEKPRAIHAHTALVRSCIYLKDNEAATALLQLLTERYGESNKLPRVLNEIAESYCELKLYDQAEPISRYVLDNYDYPQYEQCIWAQRGIIYYRLALGDYQGAKEATDVLLSKFLTHHLAEQAIGDVADAYSSQRMYKQARDLFKFNLDHYPHTNKTVWWIRGYVNHSAELGNEVGVNAGIEKLLAEFSSDEYFPTVAYHIGEKLCSKNHPRAAELLQYVIDKHPDHEEALNARVRIGHIHIRRGEDGRAESIYNDILSKYAQDPRLPQAIFLMAEGYWEKAFKEPRQDHQMTEKAKESLQKALAKWEEMITQFPNAPKVAQAHHIIGDCYYRLGQYEKAIEYFQKTVDNFPDYENAWLAQSRIAKVYKFMLSDGIMTEREAEAAMTAAYQKLIANYPDCPAAKHANEWLETYVISTEGEQ